MSIVRRCAIERFSPCGRERAPRRSAGQARSRAKADEPPPAHPFPISTMSKSAPLLRRIFKSTAHKINLRKRKRTAEPSAQPRTRVICGAPARCQTLLPSFLQFPFAVARMPHLLPRDRRRDSSFSAPGNALGAAQEPLFRKDRAADSSGRAEG